MHSYTEEITQFSDKSTHIDKTLTILTSVFWDIDSDILEIFLSSQCLMLHVIL